MNIEQAYNYHYWKVRCELAENVIATSPCDPDITKEQIKAYSDWVTFIDNKEQPKD